MIMKIRFIDTKRNSIDMLNRIREQVIALNELHAEFLYRRDSYFVNKGILDDLMRIYKDMSGVEELTIYTNDETMLEFAEYDENIHNFKVEIMFSDVEGFIPLSELHPNLREANNLMKMYHNGTITNDYVDYH